MYPDAPREDPVSDRTYTVKGMTCGHCKASVTEEIGELSGVTGVDVDLESGRVVVSGEGFTDDEVRRAVEEAGYQLV
jgi:copper chaperone